ncbi:MAG: BamA/TamA family outer membrane protein [Candidatus Aminicenantes bacterium]|nr:BamA/TamA family outer membrane protein [Candidatus Aminicenantes bacterium]
MKLKKFATGALLGLALIVPGLSGQTAGAPRLRLLTINAWSGLDYEGFFKFGEYEPAERRERRFAALVEQIQKLDPDVVFVQEANFAGRYARRLAKSLGFTEIHQVVNGGIKFGPVGLPGNFKEGMAILARPSLDLRRHDVWKLSGPFGLYGDVLTFHFGEAVFSLVGRIMVKNTPIYNENIEYSRRPVNAAGRKRQGLALAEAIDSGIGRRIDYILLNNSFRPEDVLSSTVVVDSMESGVHASDHFGVAAEVDLEHACKTSPQAPPTVVRPAKFTKDFFPILMYDTDIGFGYGLKTFLLNPLRRSESFDLTLFNSTKGERWYRFVFSWPDFETRQGKIYPVAFDLTIDYDKMIKNNFFGVGNASRYDDRVQYTREPVTIDLALSRGFTMTTVGQIGLRYATIKNTPLKDESGLPVIPYSLDLGRVSYVSAFGNFRYDSRDSFIHPSEGVVLQAEAEYAPRAGWTDVHFARLAGWFQYYTVLFYPKTIFAFRLGGQSLFGDDLPTQVLLPLGGNKTLRGSPQDRYLDRSHVIMNAELRFPIVWRLGAVVGLDAGKVWPSLGDLDFRGWVANPTIGLRFYMSTFVVRMDIGLGRETTGFYFNFGHLF